MNILRTILITILLLILFAVFFTLDVEAKCIRVCPNAPSSYTQAEIQLAYIIEGEAPTSDCPVAAQVGIAYVYQSNSTMYGWRTPSPRANAVAVSWQSMSDPTGGANFVFSDSDLKLKAVQRLLASLTVVSHIKIECDTGNLHFIRATK